MLNHSKPNVISFRQISNPTVLNSANLKFICEVCGYFAPNLDTLRTHLTDHNIRKTSSHSSDVGSKTKLNSIVTTTRLMPASGSSTIINMPQSMIVFNLKEISSKLKNFKSVENASVPARPTNSTSSLIFKALKEDKVDLNSSQLNELITENSTTDVNNNLINEVNLVSGRSSFEADKELTVIEINNQSKPLVQQKLTPSSPNPANPVQALPAPNTLQTLPYHFSEYENLYICNLCNCTYDSLRSIKAHLWKHSGHHDLSYPIHDYNNRESNITNTASNKQLSNAKKPYLQIPNSINAQLFQLEPYSEPTRPDEVTIDTSSEPCTKSELSSKASSSLPSPSGSNQRSTSGGICSALLEVIEKLRDQEESQQSDVKSGESDQKLRIVVKENRPAKSRISTRKRLKNQIKKQIKSSPNENLDVNKAHEVHHTEECMIETSVVSNLLDDDDQITQLNNQSEVSPFTEATTPTTAALTKTSIKRTVKKAYSRLKTNLRNKHRKHLTSNRKTNKLKNLANNKSKTDKSSAANTVQEVYPPGQDSPTNLSVSSSNANLSSFLSKNNLTSNKVDLLSLLTSLANNDGYEQYVCGLCNYVCYHLPSLKSHMWTHVKNIKFDYSVNTSIINAALDYENKLTRILNSIIKNKSLEMGPKSNENSLVDKIDEDLEKRSHVFLERQLMGALELINYPQQAQKLSSICNNMPMVSFRCSRCYFETIDLSLLRLHKREHYMLNKSMDAGSTEEMRSGLSGSTIQ